MVSKYTPSALRFDLQKHERSRRATIEQLASLSSHDPVRVSLMLDMLVRDTAYYLSVIDHLAARIEELEARR